MGMINDKEILEQLNNALVSNDIPENGIGLKGFGEDRMCLEKDGDEWQVYYAYRGKKHDLQTHTEIKQAAHDIIARCSGTKEQECKIKEEFEKACENLMILKKTLISLNTPVTVTAKSTPKLVVAKAHARKAKAKAKAGTSVRGVAYRKHAGTKRHKPRQVEIEASNTGGIKIKPAPHKSIHKGISSKKVRRGPKV